MFLRNDPVSKTYLSKKMSPLDDRVIEHFDNEKGRTINE